MRMLAIALFMTVLSLGQAEIAGAACTGWDPILCENGITYYPSSPDSVSGPFYTNYFNNVENKWMSDGPFCSVSWSSPANYSEKYLETDSSGGCGGWWQTGLEYMDMTAQYPGQSPQNQSYWRGAVDRLP